jgi:hypothetical protein
MRREKPRIKPERNFRELIARRAKISIIAIPDIQSKPVLDLEQAPGNFRTQPIRASEIGKTVQTKNQKITKTDFKELFIAKSDIVLMIELRDIRIFG